MTPEEILELLKKDAFNKGYEQGYKAVLQKTLAGIIEAQKELQAKRQAQNPKSTDIQPAETPSQPDQ